MHHCMNVVTGPEGEAQAVLLRAATSPNGVPATGPGLLTKAFAIDRSLDGASFLERGGDLWLEEGEPVPARAVRRTPRVGVDYAGAWAKRRLRLLVVRVILGASVLLSALACHSGDAARTCSDLAGDLYHARNSAEPRDLVELLSRKNRAGQDATRLIPQLRERDATTGRHKFRRRYLTLTNPTQDRAGPYFNIRIGFDLEFDKDVTTSETIVCEVDDSGTQGVITAIEFRQITPSK
jgi:hypothetical protein